MSFYNILKEVWNNFGVVELEYDTSYCTIDPLSWEDNSFAIVAEEWAPGIWAGAEGMAVEYRDATDRYLGQAIVTAVDLVKRRIHVSKQPDSWGVVPVTLGPVRRSEAV